METLQSCFCIYQDFLVESPWTSLSQKEDNSKSYTQWREEGDEPVCILIFAFSVGPTDSNSFCAGAFPTPALGQISTTSQQRKRVSILLDPLKTLRKNSDWPSWWPMPPLWPQGRGRDTCWKYTHTRSLPQY